MSHLHHHQIRIRLLALPTVRFFLTLYLHFKFLEAVEAYLHRHPYANEVHERVIPGIGIADTY